jgi:hypothetical protein
METFNSAFVARCCAVLKNRISGSSEIDPEGYHQHLLFITACLMLHPEMEVEQFVKKYPHGGKIGIGNSWLNVIFKRSKMLRLHAAFHDAFGVMRTEYNIGPGYCYAAEPRSFPRPNLCFVGHGSGIGFWIYLFIFQRELYNLIPV